MSVMAKELLKQLFCRPFTNPFPARHIPGSVTNFLKAVEEGKAKLNPPVLVPPQFRGAITYEQEKCNGCQLCSRVCPTRAIELHPSEKKIRLYLARCIACGQCTEICNQEALGLSSDFLLATEDKYAPELIRG